MICSPRIADGRRSIAIFIYDLYVSDTVSMSSSRELASTVAQYCVVKHSKGEAIKGVVEGTLVFQIYLMEALYEISAELCGSLRWSSLRVHQRFTITVK